MNYPIVSPPYRGLFSRGKVFVDAKNLDNLW